MYQLTPAPAIRALHQGPVFDVRDGVLGEWLGRIACIIRAERDGRPDRWHVETCGPLVEFPAEERYYTRTDAAETVLIARMVDDRHTRACDKSLTRYEQDMLDFEAQFAFVRDNGAREFSIRTLLDTTPTEHYARLAALINGPRAAAALAYDPMVVNRLLRLQRRRQALRASRFA